MQVCGPIYNINITKAAGLRGGAGCAGCYAVLLGPQRRIRGRFQQAVFQAKDAHHAMPNDMQAAMYSATAHVIKAVAGGADPADGRAVVAAMKAMPTDDPIFGKGSHPRGRAQDAPGVSVQARRSPAESHGRVGLLRASLATIPAEKAFRSVGGRQMPDGAELDPPRPGSAASRSSAPA